MYVWLLDSACLQKILETNLSLTILRIFLFFVSHSTGNDHIGAVNLEDC